MKLSFPQTTTEVIGSNYK